VSAAAVSEARLGLCASCDEDRRRERDQLRQLFGGFGRLRPIGTRPWLRSEVQSIEPKNAQHLDLLSLTIRDGVGLGLAIARAPSYCALIHNYSFWR
jgi:hypothetical protein